MSVRSAEKTDIEALVDLMAEVQNLHVTHMAWLFKHARRRDMAAYFEELLDGGTAQIFAACEGAEVAGYLLLLVLDLPANAFMNGRRSLYIESIGVRASHRGRGHGSALMETARAVAREQGCARIELDTWGFNEPAHAFFRAQGFETMCLRMAADA